MSAPTDVDPMPFSDANDADQLIGPADGIPSMGRVPDHTATSEGPADVFGDIPAPDTEKPKPWQKAGDFLRGGPREPKAPKAPKAERNSGDPVPALPKAFESDLADIYRTVGAMLTPFDQVCGAAVIKSAPECAAKLVALAKTNPDVRRALLRMVGTSAVGAVIAAHTPILMAVVSHHLMPKLKGETANGYGAPVDGENEPFPTGIVTPFPGLRTNGSM